ncbi:MAG: NUDIX hydrolase [Anaerolineae bacterium]|nr:NUDIX hydrolase [Anaerolineae bacterium]
MDESVGVDFESLRDLPVAQRLNQRLYPLPSVIALIRRVSGEYLLIERQKAPYRGKWALVGGKWDFGEPLAQAIEREVREETGLETALVGLRGIVNERVVAGDAGCHFLLFVCAMAVADGEAQERNEGPVRWFSQEDMAALAGSGRMVATDYAMVERFGDAAGDLAYVEAEVVVALERDTQEIRRFEVAYQTLAQG